MENNSTLNMYYSGRLRGFSASTLKIFAIVTMLIDHTAAVFYPVMPNDIYMAMRIIGRFAFPIFAYMIAEGARRTHNINKYLLRLLLFAFISELPFDMAFGYATGKHIIDFAHQNVYFTLFFGLLSVRCLQLFKERTKAYIPLSIAALAVFMFAANALNTDYADKGVLCIFLLYICADKSLKVKLPVSIIAVLLLSFNWIAMTVNSIELYAVLSIIPLTFYNGNKGIKLNKFFFYAFYPGHLLILYMLKSVLFKI